MTPLAGRSTLVGCVQEIGISLIFPVLSKLCCYSLENLYIAFYSDLSYIRLLYVAFPIKLAHFSVRPTFWSMIEASFGAFILVGNSIPFQPQLCFSLSFVACVCRTSLLTNCHLRTRFTLVFIAVGDISASGSRTTSCDSIIEDIVEFYFYLSKG